MNRNIQMPAEVQEVMAYSIIGHVGSSTMDRIQDIINRYPEWFPWEHKWKSIPENVHRAYLKESSETADRHGKKVKKEREKLKQKDADRNSGLENGFTLKHIENLFTTMWEQDDLTRKQKNRWRNIDRKIWNKHYKQYNLEYRK